uniref:Interferon regulatory factor like protein n=1 Tax=Ciona intestinalis TaxID=7719 RepID=F6WZ85_CIOIN
MTSPNRDGYYQRPVFPHNDVTSPPRHQVPGSPSSVTSSSSRGEPPKRLRHWLIEMIDSGSIPGLQWENHEMTIFRIPWKHAGKNNYKEEDCRIFKAWAEHRGKYKPGDKMEAATWKTRLRCALNKLPDIKELKDRSSLEGNDPYRVYQLLPEADKSQEYEIYPRSTWTKEVVSPDGHRNDPYHMAQPNEPDLTHMTSHTMTQEGIPQVDLTRTTLAPSQEFSRMRVQESDNGSCYTINKLDIAPPSDYDCVRKSVLRVRSISDDTVGYANPPNPPNHDPRTRSASGVASPSGSDASVHNMETYNPYPGRGGYENGVHTSIPPPMVGNHDVAPPAHEMEVYIRYRRSNVLACHVTEPTGCRISYGNSSLQLIASATHELPNSVFGPETLQQIELLDCEPYASSETQIQLTKHILNNLRRGLILSYSGGCFYAKRLCQSRVFVYGPETSGSAPEKLERNASVKLFDYRKFCENLQQVSQVGKFRSVEAEIRISFAQTWSVQNPIEKNLVNLYMIPRAAKYLLTKVREKYDTTFTSPEGESILTSGPDSYDRLADRATQESNQYVDELIRQMAQSEPMVSFSDINQPTYNPGYFQQCPLQVGPVSNAGLNDVEMGGCIL